MVRVNDGSRVGGNQCWSVRGSTRLRKRGIEVMWIRAFPRTSVRVNEHARLHALPQMGGRVSTTVTIVAKLVLACARLCGRTSVAPHGAGISGPCKPTFARSCGSGDKACLPDVRTRRSPRIGAPERSACEVRDLTQTPGRGHVGTWKPTCRSARAAGWGRGGRGGKAPVKTGRRK